MSPGAPMLSLRNGAAAALAEVPRLAVEPFRMAILDAIASGARVCALFARPTPEGPLELVVLLARDADALLQVATCRLESPSFPSLASECPEVALFEREIAETFGVRLPGHPQPGPVRSPGAAGGAPYAADGYRVEGEEVHEVAVGPVHAGVIEPGHFRFQCHGERVLHLEISLGYQHRGVEEAMQNAAEKRRIHYAETLAGDASAGHATAHCEALEALAGVTAPLRAQALRAIALELERLANHTGDLGALSGDVGFLPTASFCGRLRGEWLQLTAELCGSRFGRGMVRPGGVAFDIDSSRRERMISRLDTAVADLRESVDLLWASPSVMARFDGAGPLDAPTARGLGLVGPPARACGLSRDVRLRHPSGMYRFAQIPLSRWRSGDVFGRAWVRWLEIERSAAFVREQLLALPEGDVSLPRLPPRAPDRIVASLVEGWRGEICHVALTGPSGALSRYKVVDPSFHNWQGLALAMRGQEISDFPLCNKSFNLSYCGFDL